MIPSDTHLQIGSLLFEGLDQIDLTGPFEILSRMPNSTYHLFGRTAEPVRDMRGLRLTPDAVYTEAPQHMVYAPEPPFDSGMPETALASVLENARKSAKAITDMRELTARRVARRLGVAVPHPVAAAL